MRYYETECRHRQYYGETYPEYLHSHASDLFIASFAYESASQAAGRRAEREYRYGYEHVDAPYCHGYGQSPFSQTLHHGEEYEPRAER